MISGCSAEIMPRVLAGCLLGAFIAEILPHEKVSRSLGPQSGPEGTFDRNGVRRDPARRSLHRLSGGGGAAHGRRRFRRHHRHGGELDADRLRPRGRLGIADPRHGFHAVADRDLAADPGSGRRARPLRLCADVSEGRGAVDDHLRADHRHHAVGLGRRARLHGLAARPRGAGVVGARRQRWTSSTSCRALRSA